MSVTISLYKPTKKLLPVNHADIQNDTGSNGPVSPSEEDFEFVANPDADPMERDLQKKIILYQNRRSQADIEKAKKIRSMLGSSSFVNSPGRSFPQPVNLTVFLQIFLTLNLSCYNFRQIRFL